MIELINFPKIEDVRGNLTFIEWDKYIPFPIARVYWIYDVPGGQTRGGHAFRQQKEVVIALSGSFDVIVNDGIKEQHFSLNRSYFGLFIPNGLWRHMENFSTNSVALVVSSTPYSESDYIRDHDEFLAFKKNEK